MAGPTVLSRLRTTDFLRNFSWQFYCTLRVVARNLLKGNRRRNTFLISFWCLAWDSNPGFSSIKPTHYLLTTASSIENHVYEISYVFTRIMMINRDCYVKLSCVMLTETVKLSCVMLTILENLKNWSKKVLWCFLFSTKKCAIYLKEMQFCVCFLKMFRPLKGWYVLF